MPAALRFNLHGKMRKYVCGKDLILHIIGMIGVDGALYRSMEFTGEGIGSLSMDDRFTVCNMAIEAGAKNGIFPVDEKTVAYLKEHGAKDPALYAADADAVYEKRTTSICLRCKAPWPFLICRRTPIRSMTCRA